MNILLTGASRGIGKAAADALTAAGPFPPQTTVQVTVTPSAGLWRASISVARVPERLHEWALDLARHGWAFSEDTDGASVVRRLATPVPSTSDPA